MSETPPNPAEALVGPDLLNRAVASFRRRFGRTPTLGASAPGRVNLIGEHTDYNSGFVLPIAIDRRTVILASPAEGGSTSRFHAEDLDCEVSFDMAAPPPPYPRGHDLFFANYLLGVVDQFNRRGLKSPNLDAVVASTVPIGAGLSSSAALEVAAATLLEQMQSGPLDAVEKALLCRDAEHAYPGTPCGVMDMFIATLAEPDHALLIDCKTNDAQPMAMPLREEVTLLIADTGVTHELAAGEYAERRSTCELAAKKLGVPSLREATLTMLEGADLTEVQRRRAAHVVTENTRTLLAAAALQSDDLETLGDLLFASHDSLRDLYVVSCPELDTLVEAARELRGDGVIGARMTGAGFGGCAIVLCRTDSASDVVDHLKRSFEARFGTVPAIFESPAVGGAEVISFESAHDPG